MTAEGVETESQKMVLANLECDEIQGTFFSEPVSADEASAMLATYNTISEDYHNAN